MAKRRRTPDKDASGAATPRGIHYQALKGMSYRPSARDLKRRDRKQSRQGLRRGEW